jgi:DNA-binding PadR family transcriptional regulator
MHLHSITHDRSRRGRNRHRDHDRAGIHRFFHGGRGGRAVRRGNVRFALLAALTERPMHGYQIIQELESRTGGRWRPSAGSVYPTLQMLEEEGLLSSEDVEGRRTYSLTDAGRTTAAEHPLELEADPGDSGDVVRLAASVVEASAQVKHIGTPAAKEAARQILTDARRRIYQLLAEDETDASQE